MAYYITIPLQNANILMEVCMGRGPSKTVDVIELELAIGHKDFGKLKAACEAKLGRPLNASTLRVYWSYHKRFGVNWRQMMRRGETYSKAAIKDMRAARSNTR